MNIRGTKVLPYDEEELWRLFLDAGVLRRCVPGCETLERLDASRYRVTLRTRQGLLRGRFRGEVELENLETVGSYSLVVQAKGATGALRAVTALDVRPLGVGGQVELRYAGDLEASGLLSSLGRASVERAARSFVEDFFDNLARDFEAGL
jgi:carbon monoxide dehydrogenase subunit G